MVTRWNNIRTGDRNSLMELYDELYRPLFTYGMMLHTDRELVKDGIQELFCEVWEKYYDLPEVSNVKSYLFTWLRRKLNKSITRNVFLDNDTMDLPQEEIIIKQETIIKRQELLQKAMVRLTKKQRQFITLRYLEGKSYEEIATITGNSVRTVYNSVYEGLKKLKTQLEPCSVLLFSLFF